MTDTQIAESLVDEVDSADESQYDEDWTEEQENRRQGYEAGEVFINRHIVNKINVFLEIYRGKGYSENFISGFIDGISDAAQGISFGGNEESDTEEVDSQQ